MKIETAQTRLKNAAYRFLRGLDERSMWDDKLWNILRGIWLGNGAEAVNEFVVYQGLHVGVGDLFEEGPTIPVVRTNFTDADFEGSTHY